MEYLTEEIDWDEWEFIGDSNVVTHKPCSMAWSFIPAPFWDQYIANDTLRECISHQKICPMKSFADHQISREEWEDNMQRSRQKDSVDKKRDDIFKQIFN